MILFRDIAEVLTLAPAMAKEGRRIVEKDLGLQKNIEILVSGGLIVWMGPKGKCPKIYTKKIKKEISLKHQTILPGFIESHTHSIFAGTRAAEFELRNQGVSYLEIAKQGGGILSTLNSTRKASSQELLKLALSRVEQFVSQGVTTLEIKSGYGLDLKNELKILEVAKKIKSPRIVSTFLGAHALPKEYSSEEAYLDFLAEKVLPLVKKKKLSNRVDIFIEKGFFTKENSKKYLQKAQSMGFQIVIHADQLSLSGGADLAVELGALSADHLICIEDREIKKLATSQVTAVLLPTADLYMKCKYPPAKKMIDQGVRVAVATDFNPGSAPSLDLQLAGVLARLQMEMTLPQVLAAYTVGASFALGLEKIIGSLEVGKHADFIGTSKSWNESFYMPGSAFTETTYSQGRQIYAKQ